MNECHIDIETYSDIDLTKAGVYKYAQSEATRILCIAFHYKGQMYCWREWDPADQPAFAELVSILENPKIELHAHNAQFERVMLNTVGPRYGIPPTETSRWKCSAVLASLHALPRSLDQATTVLGTAPKDKTGRKIMLTLSKPRTAGNLKGQPWNYEDRPEDFEKLAEYCMDDVRAEMGLTDYLPRLPASEQKAWELDQHINDTGIAVDMDLVRLLLAAWPDKKRALDEECRSLTNGIGVTQVKGLTEWLGVKELTAPAIAKHLKKAKLSEDKLRVLELRDEARKTSITKFSTLERAVCEDDRLRGMFLFHGAQTGRWTGRIVQLHNLPRNTASNPDEVIYQLKANPSIVTGDLAQQLIRPTFIGGPDGLLIGDYAGIELRVSLWITDDLAGLSKLRSGVDLYVDMAEFIYGPEIEINSKRRFVGKQAVLGLGYGMGAPRFIEYCAGFGQTLDKDLAVKTVHAYKDLYISIVNAWTELNKGACAAVRTGKPVLCLNGRVKYVVAGNFLYCVLPSGRPIAYPFPMVIQQDTPWGGTRPALSYMSVNPYSRKWERGTTFGGRLFENICQGTASCLLRHSLQVIHADYKIVGHVHDEILAEGSEAQLPDFIEKMERVPNWAEGLPVSVEGVHSYRYLKA